MHITIRFFATLREATGTNRLVLEVPEGTNLALVTDQVIARFPELAGQQAMWHYAVNQTHAEPDTMLRAGDQVAIFPYIAGG